MDHVDKRDDFVYLALTDDAGNIFVHPELGLAAFDGHQIRSMRASDCVRVPTGSDFFSMPGRAPLGWDHETNEAVPIHETPTGDAAIALSVFLAPAFTRLMHPATEVCPDAPSLPLYAYSCLGIDSDGYPISPSIRVDADPRQDPPRFDRARIESGVVDRRTDLPKNRLVGHITNCALVYGCRAAQNYFLGRWEAPIPIARACNARCVGCISLQKEDDKIASHDRIGFNLEVAEVAELTMDHIRRVPTGIVSFGQGCEGEPLLNADLAVEAVRQVRQQTQAGTLHLNSNASRPDAVARLVEAGLDSMRVSLNSAQSAIYERYYRPLDYSFEDVVRSIQVASEAGRFVALNLLVFPGITDTVEELEALIDLHAKAPFHMIQWRNLNVDPDEYLTTMQDVPRTPPMGLHNFIDRLEDSIPGLTRGYYNPAKHKFPDHINLR
tara:strand:- start:1838 stop:3154 length:1317 start_codon:yes stop_codon:yes gene_type:complete